MENCFSGYKIFKKRKGNKIITGYWIDKPNPLDCKPFWKLDLVTEEDIKENDK